jgi:RNA polymerase sigma-70 factor (ECF subfamily)
VDKTTSELESATNVGSPTFAARIRERDAEALEEFVRRYLPHILRGARGAGLAQQLAEDVAQDTFVTFVETAPRFEGRSHVRTWLFGILYKKISAARRSRARDDEMDDIEEVFEQRFDSAGSWTRPPLPVDTEVYDAEVRQGIDDCLDRVPTNQRMAFVLREIEGMDAQEICKILEVTRTNLGVLLHRVRNRLRECLETKGIEPESHVEL